MSWAPACKCSLPLSAPVSNLWSRRAYSEAARSDLGGFSNGSFFLAFGRMCVYDCRFETGVFAMSALLKRFLPDLWLALATGFVPVGLFLFCIALLPAIQ